MKFMYRSTITELSKQCNRQWPAISSAYEETQKQLRLLTDLIEKEMGPTSSESSIVVYGSLARDEYTATSDVDWTLLIDGQSDPKYIKVAQAVSGVLEAQKIRGPGQNGSFGMLSISHNLVNHIGGLNDNNSNITQRILLLVESRSVSDDLVRKRVLRSIISRYCEEETYFTKRHFNVPRFLLNDVVRYWRTMAVDYASKNWERQGDKWALRNTKLRLSRKLLFAAGLLACLRCELLRPASGEQNARLETSGMSELIEHQFEYTPLELLADSLLRFGTTDTATRLFDCYDQFLCLVGTESTRQHLMELRPEDADKDKVFGEVRSIARDFQKALTRFFFEDNESLAALTMEYGVF
jgi:predicted nucleotidyltransferase